MARFRWKRAKKRGGPTSGQRSRSRFQFDETRRLIAQQEAARRGPWDPVVAHNTRASVERAVASLAAAETPAPAQASPKRELRPFLGYDDPMADPRVSGYVVVEYGRTVRVLGRPC